MLGFHCKSHRKSSRKKHVSNQPHLILQHWYTNRTFFVNSRVVDFCLELDLLVDYQWYTKGNALSLAFGALNGNAESKFRSKTNFPPLYGLSFCIHSQWGATQHQLESTHRSLDRNSPSEDVIIIIFDCDPLERIAESQLITGESG